jgi:hypothetical protein
VTLLILTVVFVAALIWLIRRREVLSSYGKSLFLQALGYWQNLCWCKRASLFILLLLAWFMGGIYIYRGIPYDENDVYGYHDERKLCTYALSYPVSILTYTDFRYPTGYHTVLGVLTIPLRLPAMAAFALGGEQSGTGKIVSLFMNHLLLVLGRHMSVILSVLSVGAVFWIGILLFRNFFWAFALAFAYCIDPCNVFSSYIFKPDVALGTLALCCYGCVLSGWNSDEQEQACVWFGLAVVFGVLCACFKYSAICVYPIFLLVFFSRSRREVLSVRFFVWVGVTSMAIVLLLCPSLILHPVEVYKVVRFGLIRANATMYDPFLDVFVRNYGMLRFSLIAVGVMGSGLLALVRRRWDILVLCGTLIPTFVLFRRLFFFHYFTPVSVVIPATIVFVFYEAAKRMSFIPADRRCAIGAACAILLSLGLFGPLDFRHGRWLLRNKTIPQSASDFAVANMPKTSTFAFTWFIWEPRGRLRIVPNQTIAHDGVAFFRSPNPEYLISMFSSEEKMDLDNVHGIIRSFESNGELADYYYQYTLDEVFKLWKEAIVSDFSSYRLVAHKALRGRRYREFGPYYHYQFLLYKRNRNGSRTPMAITESEG